MKKIYLSLVLLLLVSSAEDRSAYTGEPAQVMQPGQGCTLVYFDLLTKMRE